jgi:hypothetical protein
VQEQDFPVAATAGRRSEAVDDGQQVLLDGAVHLGQALVAVAVGLGDQGLGLLELAAVLGQELRCRDEDRAGQAGFSELTYVR